MPERMFENENLTTVVTHPNWGAIWSGVFTFVAIWSIFGTLGAAIFASAANPNAAHPVTGMSVGIAVWSVILTIIAMYVAGRVTGHLARIGNSRDGVVHGMIMFGLSVTSVIVFTLLAGAAATSVAAAGTVHSSSYLLTLFAGIGWPGFIALFLGWLAAMGGAATGTGRGAVQIPVQEARRAA